MYDLFSLVPVTLDELRRSMCEYVKATGKALVTDQVGVIILVLAASLVTCGAVRDDATGAVVANDGGAFSSV